MYTIEQMLARGFAGIAKPLDDIDLPKEGARIGVGEDEIHAFLEVESRGSGFDDYKRPKILFEPHIFYKLLGQGSLRDRAVAEGLAYAKWGTKKYPSDSYPRLLKAVKIHPSKALRSCSWGMTQVMGDNYKMIGYASVEEMVSEFMDDEENHLKACINFLIAANLDDDLRAHRWEAVARGYNGAGYAKNQYHIKLKKAFEKWQKIPDTPYKNFKEYLVDKKNTGDPNAVVSVNLDDDDDTSDLLEAFVAPVVKVKPGQYGEQALTPPQIKYIQTRLRNLGYMMVGKVDGKWKQGGSVTAAISALQEQCGIEVDGHYGPDTRDALARTDGSNEFQVSEARKNTTVNDLRQQGSRTIAATDGVKSTSKAGAVGLGVMGTGSAIVTYAPDALSWISPIKTMFDDIPNFVWIILGLVVCIVLWYQANKAEGARLDDERTGKNVGHPDPSPSPPITSVDSKADLPKKLPSFLRKNDPGEKEVDQEVTQ